MNSLKQMLPMMLLPLMMRETQSLPKQCHRSHLTVTCKRAHKLNANQLVQDVSYNVNVEYIILTSKSKKSLCTCKTTELLKKLKSLDVVVLTSSLCTWAQVKPCMKKTSLRKPLVMGGLAVSRNDSKLHWAVRHHLVALWEGAKSLRDAKLRFRFYDGLVKELKMIVDENQKKEIGRANIVFPELNYGTPNTSITKPRPTTEPRLEYVQMVEDDLELIRGLAINKTKIGKYMPKKQLEYLTEKELQDNLDKDLRQIKIDLNEEKTGKKKTPKLKKKPAKRSAAARRPLSDIGTNYNTSGCYPGRHPCNAVTTRGVVRHARSPKKDLSKNATLYVFPYKVYAGGKFISLYNTFAVSNAISSDVTIKFGEELLELETKIEQHNNLSKKFDVPEVIDSAREQPAMRVTESPVKKLKDRTSKTVHRMDDDTKTVHIMVDDNKTVHRINEDDEEELGELSLDTIKEVHELDTDVFDEIAYYDDKDEDYDDDSTNATNASIILLRGSTVLTAKEYDHRMRSMVVFWVAIAGIITVIGVLILMAFKGKENFAGTKCPDKKRKRLEKMREVERKEDEKREIVEAYDDTPAELPPEMDWPTLAKKPSEYRERESTMSAHHVDEETPTTNVSCDIWKRLEMSRKEHHGIKDATRKGDMGGHHVVVDFSMQQSAGSKSPRKPPEPYNPATVKGEHGPHTFMPMEGGRNTPHVTRHVEGRRDSRDNIPRNMEGRRDSRDNISRHTEGRQVSHDNVLRLKEGRQESLDNVSRRKEGRRESLGNVSGHKDTHKLNDANASNVFDDDQSHYHTTMVSFLDSIDNENRGILRFDHRNGSAWV